jgi:hypothetical protein
VGYALRSRFSLALRWCGFLLGLCFLDALLERPHQVNDLCMLKPFWCCNDDFLAFALFLEHGLDTLEVFVAVLVRLKSLAHVLNQRGT